MSDIRLDMPRSRTRSGDRLAFRGLVLLTFPMFLAVAIMSRLAPAGLGLFAAPDRRQSVFAQARQSCEANIAFAFQG